MRLFIADDSEILRTRLIFHSLLHAVIWIEQEEAIDNTNILQKKD